MTKVWYSTVLNYLINKISPIKEIEAIFSYSPSIFSKPLPPAPNRYMGPIPGIYRVTTSNKPTALILGLGYEKEAAKGLVEYLDPEETFAFYSKPAFSKEFEDVVYSNNKTLIDNLSDDHVFTHPIMLLQESESLLNSLCLTLKNNYRIILAPIGPKPFAFICLLLAVKYKDIDVWRVSSCGNGNLYDRPAADLPPFICRTLFKI